jgi:APA family basic amino acid/polyamine antiporter
LAPVVTILTCLLLMAGLPITNWIRFVVWLIIGLVLYNLYGRRHSQLSNANMQAAPKGK